MTSTLPPGTVPLRSVVEGWRRVSPDGSVHAVKLTWEDQPGVDECVLCLELHSLHRVDVASDEPDVIRRAIGERFACAEILGPGESTTAEIVAAALVGYRVGTAERVRDALVEVRDFCMEALARSESPAKVVEWLDARIGGAEAKP